MPARLAVVGAGPIGAELAQAFARLGSEVTLIGRDATLLPKEDARAGSLLASRFAKEGVNVLLGANFKSVTMAGGVKHLSVEVNGEVRTVIADEILLSVGRVPSTENMGLDGDTEGFACVHADAKSGRNLGATAVASHASEMIAEMSLAMTAGVGLGTLAKTIHPYPTQSEVWKRLGDEWNRTRFTPWLQSLFKRWLAWHR